MTKPKTPDFVRHFLYSDFMDDLIAWKMKDSCEYHVEEFKKLDEKHKTSELTPVQQGDKQDHLRFAKAFRDIYVYFSGDYGYDPLGEAQEQADE